MSFVDDFVRHIHTARIKHPFVRNLTTKLKTQAVVTVRNGNENEVEVDFVEENNDIKDALQKYKNLFPGVKIEKKVGRIRTTIDQSQDTRQTTLYSPDLLFVIQTMITAYKHIDDDFTFEDEKISMTIMKTNKQATLTIHEKTDKNIADAVLAALQRNNCVFAQINNTAQDLQTDVKMFSLSTQQNNTHHSDLDGLLTEISETLKALKLEFFDPSKKKSKLYTIQRQDKILMNMYALILQEENNVIILRCAISLIDFYLIPVVFATITNLFRPSLLSKDRYKVHMIDTEKFYFSKFIHHNIAPSHFEYKQITPINHDLGTNLRAYIMFDENYIFPSPKNLGLAKAWKSSKKRARDNENDKTTETVSELDVTEISPPLDS